MCVPSISATAGGGGRAGSIFSLLRAPIEEAHLVRPPHPSPDAKQNLLTEELTALVNPRNSSQASSSPHPRRCKKPPPLLSSHPFDKGPLERFLSQNQKEGGGFICDSSQEGMRWARKQDQSSARGRSNRTGGSRR
jgi:hypothetical protein